MTIDKNCEWCGKSFVAQMKHHNRGGARFCSINCSNLRKKRPEKPCLQCGKLFHSRHKKFCSKKCKSLFGPQSRKRENDIIGNVYGRLTVLEFLYSKERSKNYHKLLRVYRCKCTCGTLCDKFGSDLRCGRVTSCGCYKQEVQKSIHTGKASPHRDPKGAQHRTAKNIWKGCYSDGLSFDDFFRLSRLPCHYCGIELSNTANTIKSCSKEWHDQGWWKYNGLDRIDSTKDHSLENVVPACWRCNKAKGIMTGIEFANWINQVYNHLKKN